MIDLESIARRICEADHHTPWPDDSYNGRAQRRHYMKLAEAAHAALCQQLLSTDALRDGAIAAVEQDSAPLGSQLFDIHFKEFGSGYLDTILTALTRMTEVK